MTELQLGFSPLPQVRPSSRSKPSGHSQSKEPCVFTHLEPMGQGPISHSSASEHLKQLQYFHEFAPQIYRAEQARADTLTLVAGGSSPRLLTAAGELMAAVTHTHATVHTRVGSTRVSCSFPVNIRVTRAPPHNPVLRTQEHSSGEHN